MGNKQGFQLTRRNLLQAGMVVVGGSLLQACVRAVSKPGGSTGPTPVGSGSAAAPIKGEVSYWHTFTSDAEFAGNDTVMKAFSTAYPDARVTPLGVPNAQFMPKITNAVVGKNPPDTSLLTSDWIPDLVAMGALEDLTDRVNKWPLKGEFPDYVWSGATRDGKIYAMPSFLFVSWMYYRKDWAAEAGLSGPPKTWQDFALYAKKMTDPAKGRTGFGMRGGAGGEAYVLNFMQQNGVTIIDKNGQPAMDKVKAAEALKFYVELLTKEGVVPTSAPADSFNQIMTAFKTGKTGMIFHHTGSLQEVIDALGDKFGTAPLPAGPAGRAAFISCSYNGLYKGNKNPDASWKWLELWGLPATQIEFLKATGYFPSNKAVANDPRVKDNPLYAAAVETLSIGQLPPQFPGYSGWISNTVRPAFQQALLKQSTPEQAVDQMIDGLAKAVKG